MRLDVNFAPSSARLAEATPARESDLSLETLFKVASEAPPEPAPAAERVVLFLQGPPTPFWRDLAAELEAGGARILRVNLSAADWLFWRRRGALNYKGPFRDWSRWLGALLDREGVTDILYYADRLPYHRVALKLARRRGISAYAVEFGYLRPDWLTLEREGGGAYSHFPADPDGLDRDAPEPAQDRRFRYSFLDEAVWDVSYNLSDVFGRPFFPRYHSDRYYAALPDYILWLRRLARRPGERRRAASAQAALFASGAPYWLAALQLQSDYQLRASAPYPHQGDAIREVVAAFARHAGPDHRLVVKLHPLENGRENFPDVVAAAAQAEGVGERVVTLPEGDLGALIRAAEGVVTINSTVGLHALRAKRPVKALGAAIYDIEGLTDRRSLAEFFAGPRRPDPALVRALVATLAAETQVRGCFYRRDGRLAGAAEMARRILGNRVGPSRWRPGAAPPRLPALIAARRRWRRAGAVEGGAVEGSSGSVGG